MNALTQSEQSSLDALLDAAEDIDPTDDDIRAWGAECGLGDSQLWHRLNRYVQDNATKAV